MSGDILAREANYWHMIPMYFHPLRYPASDDGMATEGLRPRRHSRATRSVGSIHPWAYDAEGEVLSPRQLAAERTSGDPSGGSSIITLPRWPCSLAGAGWRPWRKAPPTIFFLRRGRQELALGGDCCGAAIWRRSTSSVMSSVDRPCQPQQKLKPRHDRKLL